MHGFFFRHAAFALALGAALPASAGTLERIRQRGVIVIAHREASIPLSYLSQGQAVGYSVDVCLKLSEAIAKQLALKAWRIEYKPVTSSTRFDVLERGEADMECGSTTNTAARRERVAFTIPHFIAASRVMVKASQPWERIEDLEGRTVASTTGTTNIQSLAHEADIKGVKLKIVPSRDHAEGVAWVQSGQVDGFAMDDVLLYGLRASAADPSALKIIGKPMTIEPYAIAFARGDAALKKLIDTEMRRLIASGELHQMYRRWFLQPIPPKGINLDMRMPHLLADSLKYPTDYVPN
jgi:glutamate/aspartate transport system substrate-binding protein